MVRKYHRTGVNIAERKKPRSLRKVERKPPKRKKCATCKELFTPLRSLMKCCSLECAVEHSRKMREKDEKRGLRDERQRLKRKSEWASEAQTAFNRFIRARDKDHPCISCGKHHTGQYHAGHYRTVGAHPELRYSLFNVHKQCAPCNNHKSGNIVEYRINLRQRIGDENLEWLEGSHPIRKYTIEELKEIKKEFNAWARELENDW